MSSSSSQTFQGLRKLGDRDAEKSHRDTHRCGRAFNLDDLLLFQFVSPTEDKSRKLGAVT